ncbi:TetR/AcrR family transcriptional regulator [Salininema proteolyticum]|uniref:TetR/AcrR family transcriptional regulator n=1 Tax=Salininema proteolyticum TaxID=1607685 RepID=A0ABV8U364_9ACTN
MTETREPVRRTQAERRRRTRYALLEAAARLLSADGYPNLRLAEVAANAGVTRGALYHQFDGKEDLALAVVEWVNETWTAEVAVPAAEETGPVAWMEALARGHAVYCRRDVAGVMMTLRVEFLGKDSPVGRRITELVGDLISQTADRIDEGRKAGVIPPGPPAAEVAEAFFGALEGAMIPLAGKAPHDETVAVRIVRGLLGV